MKVSTDGTGIRVMENGKEVSGIQHEDLEPAVARFLRCEAIALEMGRNEKRRNRLSPSDAEFLGGFALKLLSIRNKVETPAIVTAEDSARLETILSETSFEEYTEDEVARIRADSRRWAEHDFKAGRYPTLRDALMHYGIHEEDANA